jgi:hypothetical protein
VTRKPTQIPHGRSTFNVRAVYGAPMARDYGREQVEFDERMALANAISKKVDAAVKHQSTRVEAVLRACVSHCGSLGSAIKRCVTESYREVQTVRLDGRAIWTGEWRFPKTGELHAESNVTIVWQEEWAESCPAGIRSAAELPMVQL